MISPFDQLPYEVARLSSERMILSQLDAQDKRSKWL